MITCRCQVNLREENRIETRACDVRLLEGFCFFNFGIKLKEAGRHLYNSHGQARLSHGEIRTPLPWNIAFGFSLTQLRLVSSVALVLSETSLACVMAIFFASREGDHGGIAPSYRLVKTSRLARHVSLHIPAIDRTLRASLREIGERVAESVQAAVAYPLARRRGSGSSDSGTTWHRSSGWC